MLLPLFFRPKGLSSAYKQIGKTIGTGEELWIEVDVEVSELAVAEKPLQGKFASPRFYASAYAARSPSTG